MSYPSYPELKESDVEWLGKIPKHWEPVRLRYVCDINPSKAEVAGLPEDHSVSFLPMEKVGTEGEMVLNEERPLGDVLQGFTYFRNQDVIVAKITPCFENGKGALCRDLTNGIGFGSTEFHVLRARPMHDAKFIFYLTKCELFRSFGEAMMTGSAGQKRVPEEFISNFVTGTPSLEEQQAIAAFLDRKTAELDELIRLKERQIELLGAKRQALISQAVTRGLDPSVKLRPSGIEWLSEIPAHWEIKRLKYISPRINVGLVINPSTYTTDTGVPFLFGADVVEGEIKLDKARRISEENSLSLPQSRLETNDLVTVRVGYPGVTAVVPPEIEGANCASMMVIKAGDFESQWLCYAMNSVVGKYQVERVEYGAAQKQFNISDAVNFAFPVPPKTEQKAIVAYLDQEVGHNKTVAQTIREQIEKLNEYRQALISAAVTGKIDVRGGSV